MNNTDITQKKYGLLGHPLSHSLSGYIHALLMREAGISGKYEILDISPDLFDKKADDLILKYDGLNVTIPFKERIIPHLSSLSAEASASGSVNTVFHCEGASTDFEGFRRCEVPLSGRDVLLLGGGGAARVMLAQAIEDKSRRIGIYTRRKEQAFSLIKEFNSPDTEIFFEPLEEGYPTKLKKYDTIMNATPAGMWPKCDMPAISRDAVADCDFVFDSIYNPLATRLILTARSYGVQAVSGLRMLIEQARAAQKIWNPEVDLSRIDIRSVEKEIKGKMLSMFPIKIVMTGFMGSGKTSTGKALADLLNIHFRDTDKIIESAEGVAISRIFSEKGEEYFRNIERKVLDKTMLERGSAVISVGGGALLGKGNIETVTENRGFIVYLDADSDTILKRISSDPSRPLADGKTQDEILALLGKRIPAYERTADLIIKADRDQLDLAGEISDSFGLA